MGETLSEHQSKRDRPDGKPAHVAGLVLTALVTAGFAPALLGVKAVPSRTGDRDPTQLSAAVEDAAGGPGWHVRGASAVREGVQAAPDPATSPGFDEWAVTAQGRRVYQLFCARCHGGGGEGRSGCCCKRGPPLVGSALTRWQVRAAVRLGIPPGMPAFGDRLSDAEIKAVAAYVQRLGFGQPAE